MHLQWQCYFPVAFSYWIVNCFLDLCKAVEREKPVLEAQIRVWLARRIITSSCMSDNPIKNCGLHETLSHSRRCSDWLWNKQFGFSSTTFKCATPTTAECPTKIKVCCVVTNSTFSYSLPILPCSQFNGTRLWRCRITGALFQVLCIIARLCFQYGRHVRGIQEILTVFFLPPEVSSTSPPLHTVWKSIASSWVTWWFAKINLRPLALYPLPWD